MAANKLLRLVQLASEQEGRQRIARAARRETRAAVKKVRQRVARTKVALPTIPLPEGPVLRPELRVGVILDTFSDAMLRYEWQQIRLRKDSWRSQLSTEPLDLLFVESAWQGNDGSWKHAMSGESAPDPELCALVRRCQELGVPTIFWNKEDPPNFERFIDTAKLFDHVFTVDADRIPDYVKILGHDRVHLLPFAAQPRIHNPIRHDSRQVERPYEVAFAGSYFREKHAERRRQLDFLLAAAADRDLHIYSRMQLEDKRYRFPAKYQANIVGSLPYEKLLSAYTSYKVFLNTNSVTQSPTMCARRLFELSAAQTAVVSGPAAAIPEFFGEDISVVNDIGAATETLANLLDHKELRDRQALRAHRRVFDQHLATHRVNTVLDAAGLSPTVIDESVSAVVPTMRRERLSNVWQFIHRQSMEDVQLVLVTHGFEVSEREKAELQERWPLHDTVIIHADADLLLGDLMNMGVAAASGRYIAKMDDDNYYGEHFLKDLVRAFRWTDAQVVGKWAHYVHIGDEAGPTLLRFADCEHRYVKLVQGGTILTPRQVAVDVEFERVPRRVDTTFLEKIRRAGGRVYSGDRFNFISTRTRDATGHTWGVSTSHLLSHSSQLVFFGPAEHHVTV